MNRRQRRKAYLERRSQELKGKRIYKHPKRVPIRPRLRPTELPSSRRQKKMSHEYSPPLRSHIVCDKFMWVPVHKVACTSIANAIARMYNTDALDGLAKFRTASPSLHKELFYFLFVRNPWDRVVSLYAMWFNALNKPTFDRFTDIIFSNPQHKCFWQTDEHCQKQCTYSIREPDFVGRFETLNKDWQYVRESTNLPELRHLGSSPHRHYTTYYTSKTKDLVAKIYEDDIKKYGYVF